MGNKSYVIKQNVERSRYRIILKKISSQKRVPRLQGFLGERHNRGFRNNADFTGVHFSINILQHTQHALHVKNRFFVMTPVTPYCERFRRETMRNIERETQKPE